MPHVLIIEASRDLAEAVEASLADLGFRSFERAWTEIMAIDAARRMPPDLVVVGQQLDEGHPIDAARQIGATRPVPMILAALSGVCKVRLPPDAKIDGPFNAFREALRACLPVGAGQRT